MVRPTKKDLEKIRKLRGVFPREVLVRVQRSRDGGYCAEVLAFPGCFTEAETLSELIEMINDVIRTYFEIPTKYVPFMPTYLIPIEMAQRFDIFPARKSEENLKFELSGSVSTRR